MNMNIHLSNILRNKIYINRCSVVSWLQTDAVDIGRFDLHVIIHSTDYIEKAM